jgi:hypothetical protein
MIADLISKKMMARPCSYDCLSEKSISVEKEVSTL